MSPKYGQTQDQISFLGWPSQGPKIWISPVFPISYPNTDKLDTSLWSCSCLFLFLGFSIPNSDDQKLPNSQGLKERSSPKLACWGHLIFSSWVLIVAEFSDH